jgi:ABC-2 type transport system permease protein
MRQFAFLKKEINEIYKTSRIFIMPPIFLFFGFLSPLTARFMNELFKSMGGTLSGGIEIKMPDPTYIDSYGQFFKNMTSTCIIVLILVFMSTVVDEKVKGSAVLILTKTVSRTMFILSKFSSAVILFTVSYIVSAAACIYYTYLLFGKFYVPNLELSIIAFWVYGIFIISITVLASVLGKSGTVSAVLAFLGFAAASAIAVLPHTGDYTPGALGGLSMQLLTGAKTAGDAAAPVVITALLAAAVIVGSITIFRKQEL